MGLLLCQKVRLDWMVHWCKLVTRKKINIYMRNARNCQRWSDLCHLQQVWGQEMSWMSLSHLLLRSLSEARLGQTQEDVFPSGCQGHEGQGQGAGGQQGHQDGCSDCQGEGGCHHEETGGRVRSR